MAGLVIDELGRAESEYLLAVILLEIYLQPLDIQTLGGTRVFFPCGLGSSFHVVLGSSFSPCFRCKISTLLFTRYNVKDKCYVLAKIA